jgi:hypothetical protein
MFAISGRPSLVWPLHASWGVKPDDQRKPSQLPPHIAQAMLEVLTRPSGEDARRDRELRTLFVQYIRQRR